MTKQDIEAYKVACETSLYRELDSFLDEEKIQFVLKWKWSLYESLSRFSKAVAAIEQLEAYISKQEP